MAPISFVMVKPGARATAAAKHEERVGIHSHAQRVTQQRKRDRRVRETGRAKELGLAVRPFTSRGRPGLDQGVSRGLICARHFLYGLPTPSPEPDFDRPLSNYSSWSERHKYGVSMFLRMTILDINEVATNMTFWKHIVPSYAEVWTCVRDIVSAIACANQAIQTRDSDLILTALQLHLHAITTLRRDLVSLPLSAQVACCLLFDAFNVLRCDFVQAGTQIATARQLTSTVQLDAYLKDEKLATVCDALDRMSQSSAWSLWNPSFFLRYESLQHAEPSLHIELQPIDQREEPLKGLVQSMERLSRHFSGRIRRNLSEAAHVDPVSPLAQDVLAEFQIWRERFDAHLRQHPPPTERATIQQAELAWNFTYVTFTSGILSSNPCICDDPMYTPYYDRINALAEQRFQEAATHGRDAGIKAFLHIVVPSLWLTILMCRDPRVRARSIRILKSQHYQEGEFNSIVTAQVAEVVVNLESHGRPVDAAWQIPLHDRIRVEGIKHDVGARQVLLSYSPLVEEQGSSPISLLRIPWKPEGDVAKFGTAILALSQSCTLYRKVRPSAAPAGCIKPMYYKDESVRVYVDAL